MKRHVSRSLLAAAAIALLAAPTTAYATATTATHAAAPSFIAPDTTSVNVKSCTTVAVASGYDNGGINPFKATLTWPGGSQTYTGLGEKRTTPQAVRPQGAGDGWYHTFKDLNLPKGKFVLKVKIESVEYPGYEYALSTAAYKIGPCTASPVPTKAIKGPNKPAKELVAGGDVTVTGYPLIGQTLTAVAPAFKPAATRVDYQWIRIDPKDNMGIYNNIEGATSSTYTLTPADKGMQILVMVTGMRKGLVPGLAFPASNLYVP